MFVFTTQASTVQKLVRSALDDFEAGITPIILTCFYEKDGIQPHYKLQMMERDGESWCALSLVFVPNQPDQTQHYILECIPVYTRQQLEAVLLPGLVTYHALMHTSTSRKEWAANGRRYVPGSCTVQE
jgi:hypothetical protein